jgi:anti-sigma B factor antagonist
VQNGSLLLQGTFTRRAIMKIHTRTVGDVHVLDINGNITLGDATKTIRYTINDLLQNGGKKIVLNMSEVNYIDSSGIGELVRTYITVTNAGQQLKLLKLTKKTMDLLVITKLLTVFQVYEDEQAAVASFA